MKPTIGSIVIYTADDGAEWAAIINSHSAVSTNAGGAELVRTQNPLGKLVKGEKLRPNLTVMTALRGDFTVIAAREGKGRGCWRAPGK